MRATRLAAASALGDSAGGQPASESRSTTRSKATPSAASNPKDTASLAGPGCTITRWALSSLRQVWMASPALSPGTSPTRSARNGVSAAGSGTSIPI